MFRLNKIFLFLLLIINIRAIHADGLLRPVEEKYPQSLLRNRMTRIDVMIYGQFAETIVYQEFVNDWNYKTDAVYSFPLPPDARANNFYYWQNDQCYKAVLRVQEQAPNPGTGEGGVAALINKYIGRNGIKIMLKDVAPRTIQKTQLHYISRCDYDQGKMSYEFPLDTQEFVQYPLDLLQVFIHIRSDSTITNFAMSSHPDWKYVFQRPNEVKVALTQSKAFLTKNLKFDYSISNKATSVDFYSVANDSMAGHFVLSVQPDETIDSTDIFSKRIIFLLEISNKMFGDRLTQSKDAIKQCLDLLKPTDYFNIGTFAYNPNFWKTSPVPATPQNIAAAKQYITSIYSSSGSMMQNALLKCLAQFPDQNLCNSILAFSSGFTVLDPQEIENKNVQKTGIFMIGIGEDLERARLEMTSLLNYGFVTYFDEDDNLLTGITRVFQKISQPILKDTRFEFGQAGIHEVFPTKAPTIYQGSRLYLTGRYLLKQQSAFSIAGYSMNGAQALDYRLNFSNETTKYKFAEAFWAKEKIDALEREVLVYGENPAKKQELIRLSLTYHIRCKYTAYIATYEDPIPPPTAIIPGESEIALAPESYLIGNYPNPFNPTTTIQFYLAPTAELIKYKFIRIYNLLGQLVSVIDISYFNTGTHALKFNGMDFNGNPLPSGMYLCQLVVGSEISTIRINLVK